EPGEEGGGVVGRDERIGAMVPPAASRARLGARPRAIRSCTSGRPTPSRPITATLPAAGRGRSAAGRFSSLAPPPRRSRSSQLTVRVYLHLFLGDPDHLGDGRDPGAHGAPAVVAQSSHPP